MIILGIIAVVILYTYLQGLFKMPEYLPYFGIMAAICVVAMVVLSILNKVRLSDKQNMWIAEGNRIDEENKRKNENLEREAIKKKVKEQNASMRVYRNEIAREEERLSLYEAKLALMDVLAKQDMNLETVEFLINQIETRRANSVTDALRQYDAHNRDVSKRQFEYDMARMRQEQEAERRLREAEDGLRQTLHNLEMQKEAKRATRELEEINQRLRDLENGR